ncbi:MAG: SRPBCC family protein [Deltaproteobacteria bacterium]|nr:SRPBCC family protein [Deltaproteobacteria bacterium]
MFATTTRRFWAVAFFLVVLGLTTTPHVAHADARRHEVAVTVDAAPEVVWPFLIDEDLIAKWNDDPELSLAFPDGRAPHVGKRIVMTLDVPTHPTWTVRITRLDGPRHLEAHFVDGIFRGIYEYRLTPVGDATRVVQSMSVRPQGWFYRMVWGVAGKRIYLNKMRTYLDNLKRVVEETGPATTAPKARDEIERLRPGAIEEFDGQTPTPPE